MLIPIGIPRIFGMVPKRELLKSQKTCLVGNNRQQEAVVKGCPQELDNGQEQLSIFRTFHKG
jgi:hypothetical protein